MEVEIRFDDALRPGDPRLDLAAVTAPRTLTFRTYFEHGRGKLEFGRFSDEIRPDVAGAFSRTVSINLPHGWVADETTGSLDLMPATRSYRWHGGRTHYAFSAGPSPGERVVSGSVEDPSRGLRGYGELSEEVPVGTFDSSAGELVAAAVPLGGRFEGHFWVYDETRGGRTLMSVRHAGWAQVGGDKTAVIDLVKGLLPAEPEGARPEPGRITDGRPEKGVRLFIDPETRRPLRIEATMATGDGVQGLLIAIPPDA